MSKLVKKPAAAPKLLDIEKARDALARCVNIDEAKHYRDAAVLIEVYHRQQKAGRDALNDAGEIKVRAERRLGELLARQRSEGLRSAGGRPKAKKGSTVSPVSPPTLKELDINRAQAKRWQKTAKIPAKAFEAYIAEQRKAPDGEISAAGLRREALPDVRRAERVAAVVAKVKARIEERGAAPEALGIYTVIDADPAWRYEGGTTDPSRQIENHYPTMLLEEICALKVGNVAHEDSILFLHHPAGMATQAVQVATAWGFRERSSWVWVKPSIGPGYWGRLRHEMIMICTRGKFPTPAPSDRFDSVIEAPRAEHSEKPVEVYERIEQMFPEMPKLELFARARREGWAALGHGVGTPDIAAALEAAGKPAEPEIEELPPLDQAGLSIVCRVCHAGVNTPCAPEGMVLERAHAERIADEKAAR